MSYSRGSGTLAGSRKPAPANIEQLAPMQIYIGRDGKQLGPYSLEEINQEIELGRTSTADLAWHEGMPGWVPLSSLPGVRWPNSRQAPPHESRAQEAPKSALFARSIYLMQGNERVGPMEESVLREKFANRKVAANDLLWYEGMAQWSAIGDYARDKGWPTPATPPSMSAKYKEYVELTCRECGYRGNMGVKAEKIPWYLTWWSIITFLLIASILSIRIGFFGIMGLMAWRHFSTKNIVECPNCGRTLQEV
jgi:hypothetical protein